MHQQHAGNKQRVSRSRLILILSLLSAPWLGVAVPYLGVATAAAQEEALAAERTEVESVIRGLQRAILELDEEKRLLAERRRALEIDLAAQQREHDRLLTEERALRLEARGKSSAATYVRREAALRREESQLRAQRKELELERLQTVEPLRVEKQDLDLRRRELRSGRRQLVEAPDGGSGDELEELERLSYQLSAQIEDMQYDIRQRQHAIDGELATLRYRRYELQRQKAHGEGEAERAAYYAEHRERTLRRRTELEVAVVFEEVDAELRRAMREPRRILREAPRNDPAHEEANATLRRLTEERKRLRMTRQTYREEAKLARLEDELSTHLVKLETTRLTASATEATELEEEITRLRAALSRLVSLAASGETAP